MNPTTPANPGSAMSHGGTFMRPGAVVWGHAGRAGQPQPTSENPETLTPGTIEQALDAAVKHPDLLELAGSAVHRAGNSQLAPRLDPGA